MAEAAFGQELGSGQQNITTEPKPVVGVKERILSALGRGPKPVETPATHATPPQSSEELRQIIEGKNGLPAPRDFGGPGLNRADRIQMGENPEITSPGATTLEETKKRLEAEAAAGLSSTQVEPPTTQPAYLGPSEDDKPLASQAEPATPAPEPTQIPEAAPDNVVPFPAPAEQPLEKPAA